MSGRPGFCLQQSGEGSLWMLAEKEDSVTAALLHLVQCGGSTSGSQILLGSLAQGLAGAGGAEAAAAAG